MDHPADVTREVEALAQRVLASLEASGARKSSWDLKMELKAPHTRLHLALGWLAGRGRIALSEGPLTLVVELSRSAAEALQAPQNPEADVAPAAADA